ncbi:RHS repeat-associated core domain-containing protein [Wenjunlia vitaminophila]|uniref:RHS repeat-associated core domain-containing protein n=1 Tax=Wenjunlia vitaminophila TaxID=76728 RepID=UPI000717842A|nr:RHS repeat-associated core domain-containing protein [Wenjunlia vitaminophila]
MRVLEQHRAEAAGINGLLLTLTPKDTSFKKPTQTTVTVDYTDFAQAFGGAHASRLRLVELPDCVLTTPSRLPCREATPLASRNDTEKQTLTSSEAPLRTDATTVLAVVAEAASDAGDFRASPLSSAATWNTDLSSGHFNWAYGMPAPDVPGGLVPDVSLNYSSGRIDGRTGNTNNQSSWVGDGFDLGPGYIERRYKPCSDDGVTNADGNKPGDLCWGYDNATISFNGGAGELVPVSENEWKLKDDDGTKIARLTNSARDNGDDNNEYWRVTTPDGTQYFFEYNNKLNGWVAGKDTTESTWTVPVFGNGANDPCHASTFAESWCQQAWRWNLDYVVDPHGNAMAYYYTKETNSYGRNLKAEDDTSYIRGGYLDRVEYGLESTDLYAKKALAKVDFTSSERCLSGATSCAEDAIDEHPEYWQDTPWDLNCAAGTDCDQGRLAPTFWTRKRLTQIDAQILKADSYTTVDSWTLGHEWGEADVDRQLLLTSVQHTGKAATPAIALPKVTFDYTQRPNRLDRTGDGKAPFIKARLSSVLDEFGGEVAVNYSDPVCDWDALPTPESNTTRCFPQFVGGTTTEGPTQQWFNKYVVSEVAATDLTGGAEAEVTRYQYLDGAAWHYDDDDGLTKEKFKTWSTWRGYGHVRELTGGPSEGMKSQQDSYFLRGMHGDRAGPEGGTKDVTVTLGEGEGDPIVDHSSVAGFAYKTETYSAPGGKILSKTVDRPWHHQTASRTRPWGTVTADFSGIASSRDYLSLDDGAGAEWRVATSSTTYDTVAGRPVTVDDRGDAAVSNDNQCTRTWYAPAGDGNFLSAVSRVETVAVSCDATPDRSTDVISDVRTAYDGGAYGQAPTKGDATAMATLKKHSGTQATYLESGVTFDQYGRELAVTDLTANVVFDTAGEQLSRTPRDDGRTTTTAYTPTTGIPTSIKVTSPPADADNPATAQTTTTTLEPLRGLPVTEIDTNNLRTDIIYDALGRTWKIWRPDRVKNYTDPSYEFTYAVAENRQAAVGTIVPGPQGRLTSYTLYDGFLRPRQTQSPGPDGGRLLTDTFYDDRGLPTKTFAPYYALGAPSIVLQTVEDAREVESQTWTTYDGLGRATESKEVLGNGSDTVTWATSRTTYHGDRTTVIPPEGATATTALVDARGRATELRQHHTRSATAPFDTTRYTYTPGGEMATLTDPAGNAWEWAYDQLGRLTRSADPDSGATRRSYDDRSLLVSTTDAREQTLFHAYDNLGRPTELRSGSETGDLLAAWTYDTVSSGKGQLASSTRYDNGHPYTSTVAKYDKLYRPTLVNVTIPENEGALAGTYPLQTGYNSDGTLRGYNFPPAGSLPGGGVTYTYDAVQRPVAISDWDGMKATTTYSLTGKPLLSSLSNDTTQNFVDVTFTWEDGTQRLANTQVHRMGASGVDKDATYTYDAAGNVLSVSDTSRTGTDTQCFTHDYLRRITAEWTQATSTCAASPSASVVGGPAPYWNSYTYDKVGNRLTETNHDLAGDPTQDTTRGYTYPAAGSGQPHALTSVTTQGPTGTAQDTYTYHPTGDLKTRSVAGNTQTYAWDLEGHVASVTEPVEGDADRTTSYVYDADGNRLIGRTDTETTLYLGATEITLAKGSSTPKVTRYIDLGNGLQAIQTDDGALSFVVGDHHGTGQLAIATDASLTMQQRRTEPFGRPRGQAPVAWPGTKGFVGGTTDSTTGLTHLGAREYDPATGRFISVDPVMDPANPQQLNGYAYANNNPATYSDPTGLLFGGLIDAAKSVAGKVGDKAKQGGGWVKRQWGRATGASGSFMHGFIHGTYESATKILKGYYILTGQGQKAREMEAGEQSPFPNGYNIPKKMLGEPREDTIFRVGEVVAEFFFPFLPSPGGAMAKGSTKAPKVWKLLLKALGKASSKTPGKTVPKAPANIPARIQPSVANTCFHSFLPGTDVLLADGSSTNIEDVEPGDKVTVTDPTTGTTTTRPVAGTITTEDDKHFVDLTITTPDGTTTLTSTTTHPFWVQAQSTWIEAGDLTPGTHLTTPTGDPAVLTATHTHHKQQRTHDLTIRDIHTYYVLAGATPVLVHNCGPGVATEDDAMLALSRAEELQASRNDYFMADVKGTTAVIGVFNSKTKAFATRIGINGGGAMPSGWTLRPGEEFVQAAGHAEEGILNSLGPNEHAVFGAASRNFCVSICSPMLNVRGITVGGAGIRGHAAQNSPFTIFWATGG